MSVHLFCMTEERSLVAAGSCVPHLAASMPHHIVCCGRFHVPVRRSRLPRCDVLQMGVNGIECSISTVNGPPLALLYCSMPRSLSTSHSSPFLYLSISSLLFVALPPPFLAPFCSLSRYPPSLHSSSLPPPLFPPQVQYLRNDERMPPFPLVSITHPSLFLFPSHPRLSIPTHCPPLPLLVRPRPL